MTLFKIFCILCFVESGADPKAVGDSGKAVGIVQIHQICLEDVGMPEADRTSVVVSWQVFRRYMKKYHCTTLEECARVWNGGPRGKADTAYVRKAVKLAQNFNGEQQIRELLK